MPEPYWPKRKGAYLLSDAHALGHLARIECRYCKIARLYSLDDLRQVLGNIEVDDVAHAMRCQKCGEKRTLRIDTILPGATERQGMIIRKLEKIYYVRRATWRDEKA